MNTITKNKLGLQW